MKNKLLELLARYGIDDPNEFLVSPEGKRMFGRFYGPTRSREEVEQGFASLKWL